MNSIERPSSRCSSRTRLRIAPWTETSRAEVISSARSTSGRPARARAMRDPLALAARRARAGSRPRGPGRGGRARGAARPRLRRGARAAVRSGRASATLAPMRHPRVERGERVLEDHLERAAPCRASDRLAVEQDPPAVHGARPTAARARVDLPDPDSPTSPRTRPSGTVRLTPSTDRVPCAVPKRTVTSSNSQLAHASTSSISSRLASSDGSGSPACQQATRWPARVGHQRRAPPAAELVASGQRAANAQPAGTCGRVDRAGRGWWRAAGRRSVVHVGHRREERPGVRVRGAAVRARGARQVLDDPPGVHDQHAVADLARRPRRRG